MSLVLTRKENEAVYIDKHIKVTVVKSESGAVLSSYYTKSLKNCCRR